MVIMSRGCYEMDIDVGIIRIKGFWLSFLLHKRYTLETKIDKHMVEFWQFIYLAVRIKTLKWI